jgi:hypothetical protein
MMEVSNLEIVLFAWGMAATAYALKYKHEVDVAKYIIREIVTDEKVRTHIVGSYEKHKKEHGA